MAGALEKKRMLIKYSNASLLGYKANASRPNMAYTMVLYGSYANAEADKAKKEIQKTDNPEAWLIESL
jgi:hypothetical protein